jgi:hypothetical protein
MSLEILKNNEKFYLHGKLNTTTLNYFTTYFESNLQEIHKVTLNIDNVIEIDEDALNEIKELARITLLKEKKFSIVGVGCKEIYEHFNQLM